MKTLNEFLEEAEQHRVDENVVSTIVKGVKIAAPLVRRGIQAVKKVASKAERAIAPSVENRLGDIPIKTDLTKGRALDPGEKIVKYTRNMDPAELTHANKTGYFLPKPGEQAKWWTPHGEKGVLGRTFKAGRDKPVVTIDAKDFDPNKAVSIKNATVGGKPAIDTSLPARASRAIYKAGRIVGINEDV